MNLTAIRTWHWMVIGLLAGALYGYVRDASANFYDELGSYGTRRLGQREFEQALTKKFHGRPCLSDMVVSAHRLSRTGAPAVTLHVVAGMYCDGRTQVEDGKVVARWEPAYFVASVPYVPINPPTGKASGGAFENVMAYLKSPWHSEPVQFQYLRWSWATRPQFFWTCAGFVMIGVVWPTVVNLLMFGTLLRPREARGLSLWKVKPAQTSPAKNPDAPAIDPALLETLARGLEADSANAPTDPPPVAPPQPRIQTLRGAEAKPAAAVAEEKKKDFGADKEDFYPTELRARHGD